MMLEWIHEVTSELGTSGILMLTFSLLVAFGFEFINGFHDTANAVTTVIYSHTLKPIPAVVYSGICNFLGVLIGGTAVAFAIVDLLPVDLLVDSASMRSIAMVISLLLAGVTWNLGTWWFGLPVSSSHTLVGSVLGVGLANSLLTRGDLSGVRWDKAIEVGASLLVSPLIGFVAAGGLLLSMKGLIRDPKLYQPPVEGDRPPNWIRGTLLATCGAVSAAHGSNDGQKGMGLILLVLIGFFPAKYALDTAASNGAKQTLQAAESIQKILNEESPELAVRLNEDLKNITELLAEKTSFKEIPLKERWRVRKLIFELREDLHKANLPEATRKSIDPYKQRLSESIESIPLWVMIGVAVALGLGTGIGYKRVVTTVAEKIGKTHLTYGQGAAAEIVAAGTIILADVLKLPVSTTHVLASGIAGTMWANSSGVQMETVKKIGLAWVLTLPAAIGLSASLFLLAGIFIPEASPPAGTYAVSP